MILGTRGVERVVGHHGELGEDLEQELEGLRRAEELEVGLLVDVAVRAAPAVYGIGRRHAVGGRLTVDGQDAVLVQADEALVQMRRGERLGLELTLDPRQLPDVALDERHEHLVDVVDRGRLAPRAAQLVAVERRLRRKEIVAREVAVRRRRAIAPATVREFIPVTCTLEKSSGLVDHSRSRGVEQATRRRRRGRMIRAYHQVALGTRRPEDRSHKLIAATIVG